MVTSTPTPTPTPTHTPPLPLPTSLEDALIPTLPRAMYYIPNFITPAEESHLLYKINSSPLPHWHHLSHRRLQVLPSALSPSNTLLSSALPTWLYSPIIPRLLSIPVSSSSHAHLFGASPHAAPNHCLINQYRPAQGILPHEDGSAYYPIVATVSLGSAGVLDLYDKCDVQRNPKWRVLQEQRSLLITSGEMYEAWLHGITGVEVDERLVEVVNWGLVGEKEHFSEGSSVRGTRVSLTFRDVVKVKILGKGLGFLNK